MMSSMSLIGTEVILGWNPSLTLHYIWRKEIKLYLLRPNKIDVSFHWWVFIPDKDSIKIFVISKHKTPLGPTFNYCFDTNSLDADILGTSEEANIITHNFPWLRWNNLLDYLLHYNYEVFYLTQEITRIWYLIGMLIETK